ncbi:hypothetical protein SAMN05421819_2473 [Bryocella elongata]|uniref:VWFA-related domain-containing protein n=1 Tax=Bryocella elongata TaxID=863522 RepID=A0A1H5Z5L6_9BACT|nr:hypothetical protein [Bryocella elongata]SEG31658.1 hypothetical protein SAMN05421819_2473 [Bryocella elongata]
MFKPFALVPLGLLGIAAASVCAQGMPVEGPASTTAIVYAESKSNVPLDPQSLQVQVNGHNAQVTGVEPVTADRAQVAILIDGGLRSSFNLQIRDIQQFVNGLPPTTEVLIGYMENGRVVSPVGFTTDRERLMSSLHASIAIPGLSASPYFCLSDFVKNWPASNRSARFVLMITNGVDPYNGAPTLMNQDSPYVETAQNDAARAGVAVYSIYYPDAGFRGGRGSLSGQGYLSQVGDATGGMVFNNGSIPPVSISPYLDQFSRAMKESYLVTFMAATGNRKPNTMDRLKVKTSQQGVKVHAPESVHPGMTE